MKPQDLKLRAYIEEEKKFYDVIGISWMTNDIICYDEENDEELVYDFQYCELEIIK